MRSALLAASLTFFNGAASASNFASSARGTTTAEFLRVGVGARAEAMGEAYSAVADEASAVYWNPAALTRIHSRSATFMHAAYIGDSYFDFGAYAQRLRHGAVGAAVQYFSAGGITQTDASGKDTGTFTPYDLAATGAFAWTPASPAGFSLGAAAKFIRSHIATSAQTAALDIGALSPPLVQERLRLAASLSNIGGAMRFDSADESLPLVARLGSAARLTNRLTAALDVIVPRDDGPSLAAGSEYWLLTNDKWKFAARAGFNSQTIGSIDGFTGVSFGIGIGYSGLAVDYALLPVGALGQAHRVSLTCSF